MARLTLAAFLLAAALPPVPALAQSSPPPAQCGSTRWAIKTLGDPAAQSLSARSVPTTIEDLIALKPPAKPDSATGRIAPAETTLWSVRARLLAYWLETDSDYHLLLSGLRSDRTLYAEIPSPDCVQSRQSIYDRERAFVDSLGKRPATQEVFWLNLNGATPPIVTVVGYGFFDHIRGFPDVGEASNGIEIHPVLQIQPYK